MPTPSPAELQKEAHKNLADLLQVDAKGLALSEEPANLRITLTGKAAEAYSLRTPQRHVPRQNARLPMTLNVTPILAELAGMEKHLPSISSQGADADKPETVQNVTFHLGGTRSLQLHGWHRSAKRR